MAQGVVVVSGSPPVVVLMCVCISVPRSVLMESRGSPWLFLLSTQSLIYFSP